MASVDTTIRMRKLPHVNGGKPHTYYPIAIVGAGESGICLACYLKKDLDFTQYRIFERKAQLGGTWYTNRYPGVACDIAAFVYSFSFAQNPKWTALYPPGSEIVKYLYDVCSEFQVLDKIQCDTNVKSMQWVEADEEWELVLEHLAPGVGDLSTAARAAFEQEHGVDKAVLKLETIRAKAVASAVGGLVEPKPHVVVEGQASFEGKIMHTAEWDPTVDLKDKHVVVVGTGCSAGQVVPELVKNEIGPAAHVTQLLRSPPWAVRGAGVGRAQEAFTKTMSWVWGNIPGSQNAFRKYAMLGMEIEFQKILAPTEAARKRRKIHAHTVLEHMHQTAPHKYHEILTPDYELFCKRRVVDNGWFRSLQDTRVEIDSRPLTKLGPGKQVTIGPGRHYPPMSQTDSKAPTKEKIIPCDVLIMANGYATNDWLHPLDVTGKDGKSLHEVWKEKGGARAYYGTAMPGFPNFFMIFGPNTATGHNSVILASENASVYALHFLRPLLNSEITRFEVTARAEEEYTRSIQDQIRSTVFASGGCVNWYADRETGWNSTVYPGSQVGFSILCMAPFIRWSDWQLKSTAWGTAVTWVRRTLRVLTLLIAIVGVRAYLRLRRSGSIHRLRDAVFQVVGQARTLISSYGRDR